MRPANPATRPMTPAAFETLAERVGIELRRLPVPRAPHTLLPRVMAAVDAWARRPWYTRAWFTWPLGWQVASVVALLSILAGGAVLWPSAQTRVAAVASQVAAGPVREVAGVAAGAEATTNAAFVVGRAIIQPLAVYAFVFVMLMSLACAAFGAALNHVAFGRTLHL